MNVWTEIRDGGRRVLTIREEYFYYKDEDVEVELPIELLLDAVVVYIKAMKD